MGISGCIQKLRFISIALYIAICISLHVEHRFGDSQHAVFTLHRLGCLFLPCQGCRRLHPPCNRSGLATKRLSSPVLNLACILRCVLAGFHEVLGGEDTVEASIVPCHFAKPYFRLRHGAVMSLMLQVRAGKEEAEVGQVMQNRSPTLPHSPHCVHCLGIRLVGSSGGK